MGPFLNADVCEVRTMNRLIDLIKRYIEKRNKQSSGNSQDSAESQREIANLEDETKNLDSSPENIHSIAENIEPEDLDNAVEIIDKAISREVTWKKPIRISDKGFVSSSISMNETGQGLERQVERPLIIAACGKVIKEEDIGIKCSVCEQYDCKEHSFLCNCCGKALCIVHVCFFKNEEGENVPHCAECYKKVVENQDTWKSMPDMFKKWGEKK